MPPVIAAAAIGAGGMIAGGVMQSRAAGQAARHQTNAANTAAQLEAQSQAEQLAFLREQADLAQRQAEVDRRANYEQWASREGRLGSVGQALGFGGRSIPGYVPSAGGSFGQPPAASATPGQLLGSRSTIDAQPPAATLRLPDPHERRSVGAQLRRSY